MIKTKLSRRRWLLMSALLAASTGPAGGAAASELSLPLTYRLLPLGPSRHPPVVTAMAIDPRGEVLAVAGDDASIRILDAGDLREYDRLVAHRDLVRTLTFRCDSKILASGGNDGSLILWDRNADWAVTRRLDDLPTLFCVRFSPDGKQLAAVGFDSELMLFGSSSEPQLQCQCSDLRGVAYDAAGGRLAVSGRSGTLYLYDPHDAQQLGAFPIHTSRVRDLVFLPGTALAATVAEDGAATIFDLNQHRVVKRIDLLPCKLFTVAAIDRQQIAVAGSDNRIRIVDCVTGAITDHLDGHQGSISSLVFSNGWLYSGGFDATVRKWNVSGGAGERVAEKEPADDGKR